MKSKGTVWFILGGAQTITSSNFFPQSVAQNRLTGTSFGHPGQNTTYDYIVVGAGLAGGVVAARILENTNATVALIEAGSFYELANGNWSQIPFYSRQYIGGSQDDIHPVIDWRLTSQPEPGAAGRRFHYAQGKNVGGSSGRIQMIYHRGTVGLDDLWAHEIGDSSHSWQNMLPFLKKTATFTSDQTMRAVNATANYTISAFDNPDGPLQVSYPDYSPPFSSHGAAAFAAAGFPAATDFSSGVLSGYGLFPYTVNPKDGIRSSSETAFVSPSLRNDRFTVYQSSQVMKVVFDTGKTATGVLVKIPGMKPYQLNARKEIVLSAGVFHSPQLLMLSGIGPRATLERLSIPVLVDSPGVGRNMHDSCNIGGPVYEIRTPSFNTLITQPEILARAREQFNKNGSGPLTSPGGDFVAWEKVPKSLRTEFSNSTEAALARWPEDWPEIEIVMGDSQGALVSSTAADGKFYGKLNGLIVAAISRGNVTIVSDSIDDAPVFQSNWLQDPADQQLAVAAYRRMRDIWQHIDARIGEELSPGPDVQTYEDLLKFIQEKGISAIHHGSSTNRMGRANDTMAVVDSRARVKGVQKLRVIDSSSFYYTPPGHTQGTTYGHAEKLVADLIDDNQ